MLVKGSFKGSGMIKYGIFFVLIKIGLFVAWIFTSKVYFFDVINHIESVINTGADISLMYIITQICWIFGYFVLAILIESFIMFAFIMPIAKNEINSRR